MTTTPDGLREIAVAAYGTCAVITVAMLLTGHDTLAAVALTLMGAATVALTIQRIVQRRHGAH